MSVLSAGRCSGRERRWRGRLLGEDRRGRRGGGDDEVDLGQVDAGAEGVEAGLEEPAVRHLDRRGQREVEELASRRGPVARSAAARRLGREARLLGGVRQAVADAPGEVQPELHVVGVVRGERREGGDRDPGHLDDGPGVVREEDAAADLGAGADDGREAGEELYVLHASDGSTDRAVPATVRSGRALADAGPRGVDGASTSATAALRASARSLSSISATLAAVTATPAPRATRA